MAKARRLLFLIRPSLSRRVRPMVRACLIGALALAAPAGQAEIRSATFSEPTTRYAHGVLGDAIEWGALDLRLRDGTVKRITLPLSRVFEDLEPRLIDVDLDGDVEAVVVESHQNTGGRLSIYDETGLVAATPHIGRSNRWLAPIGGADLDGDGRIELAYIDRPHLAKTLRIWRFKDGKLSEVATQTGLTNHRIGEDFITGGIRTCAGQPEMITANAQWSRLIASSFDGTSISTKDLGPFSPKAVTKALNCE